jgi:hypothetical protein
MSLPLTVDQVVQRLNNFPHDNYLYIGGFMRSVALAAGTFVLLEILLNFRRYWPRLLPWLASLLAVLVTLMTWGRGILLTNSKANIWDAVLPLLMGITEFVLFAILAPQKRYDSEPVEYKPIQPWNYWFFAHAIHGLLAFFLVWNRISNTDVVRDFQPELRPLGAEYLQWIKLDRIGAFKGFAMFTVLGILTLLLARRVQARPPKRLHYLWCGIFCLLPLVPLGIYCKVVYDAEKQRERTDQVVFELKESSLAPGAVDDSSAK